MRISDWSSDVCSSDLDGIPAFCERGRFRGGAATAPVPDLPEPSARPVQAAKDRPDLRASDRYRRGLAGSTPALWLPASPASARSDRRPRRPRHRRSARREAPCPCSSYRRKAGPADRKSRRNGPRHGRSEEHTSELQSLKRISYAAYGLKKKKKPNT